jgi:hypothetical protein
MESNAGTFYTSADGTTEHKHGGLALPFQPKPAKQISYSELLAPLDAAERRQFALYMRFAAETANREMSDVAALLDVNTLATITGAYL